MGLQIKIVFASKESRDCSMASVKGLQDMARSPASRWTSDRSYQNPEAVTDPVVPS